MPDQTPRISARARAILRANPSVLGFSETLKPKLERGQPVGPLAIRVYVEKKRDKPMVPEAIDGVPTDVVVIGKVEPTALPPRNRGSFRPLEGGASGMYRGGSAGTLGYFMRDKRKPPPPNKPQWYALSCAHVLHPGTAVNETLQPSPRDGGVDPIDRVGRERLWTYFGVDAALSALDERAIAAIIDLPAPVGTSPPWVGKTVAKSGRTTGVTFGKVFDDGAEFKFATWSTSPGPVRFRDVILVWHKRRHFSEGGDSGSLVIDPGDDTAVGMVFGGSTTTPKYTLVASIRSVLKAFPNQMLVRVGETWP